MKGARLEFSYELNSSAKKYEFMSDPGSNPIFTNRMIRFNSNPTRQFTHRNEMEINEIVLYKYDVTLRVKFV